MPQLGRVALNTLGQLILQPRHLELALDPDDQYSYVVAVVYFWLYFFLMMLVLLNIVIAILMDGYASVKRTVGSVVEEQLKYNAGPLLPSLLTSWRHRAIAASGLGA